MEDAAGVGVTESRTARFVAAIFFVPASTYQSAGTLNSFKPLIPIAFHSWVMTCMPIYLDGCCPLQVRVDGVSVADGHERVQV